MSSAALAKSYLPSQDALQEMSVPDATLEPLEASEQLRPTKVPLEQASTSHNPDRPQTPSREYVANNKGPPPSEYDSMTEISENENSDTEGFQLCQRSKRRKRKDSGSSNETVLSQRSSHGLVVVFQPTDPKVLVNTINAIKLTQALEANCPDGVHNIRPNMRLNLLAVDTRNTETTSTLLRITTLCGVSVKAYEPRLPNMAVGVIHGITSDISELHLRHALRSSTPVVRLRRLGQSQSVALTFDSKTLPEDVTVGYVRYKVYLYVERPTQCTLCRRLGHIAAACRFPSSCASCGKIHEGNDCTSAVPHCVNCGRGHTASSRHCPKWREEKYVAKYRRVNHVDYPTAKAAVRQGNVASKTSTNLARKDTSQPVHPTTLPAVEAAMTPPVDQTQLPRAETVPVIGDTEIFPPIRDTDSRPLEPRQPSTAATVISRKVRKWGPSKKEDQHKTPHLPPRQTPPSPSATEGSGGIIDAVVNILRSFLLHLSTPTSASILQLLDIIYPIIRGLFS